ncbi:hypothetical protein AALO_G00228370 [Alosa alosa]|uniref:Uncharacterized protein n=1 Tax=Alosa alosa TaxID=278164 RepID=A0AAV6FYV2_9TELE|nr:hypothetical protein AALO_G00228370 [Alosa alosa]
MPFSCLTQPATAAPCISSAHSSIIIPLSYSARGDYSRAAKSIQNSNIDDERVPASNTRIMRTLGTLPF